jgi:hypothetical protein
MYASWTISACLLSTAAGAPSRLSAASAARQRHDPASSTAPGLHAAIGDSFE